MMNNKTNLLLIAMIVVGLIAAVLLYQKIWSGSNTLSVASKTIGNHDDSNNSDASNEISEANNEASGETIVDVVYIAKLKENLSDSSAKYIKSYMDKLTNENKRTDAELQVIESNLVLTEMKKQILNRYYAETPNRRERISVSDTDEDFGMAILNYYDEHSIGMVDGGKAVRDVMKSAMDSGNVSYLDLWNIQEAYSEKQQATTRNINSNTANKEVYGTLLSFYKEVELMNESETAIELKKLIKEAVSDDFVSVSEFNKIEKLYLDTKEANSLRTLKNITKQE